MNKRTLLPGLVLVLALLLSVLAPALAQGPFEGSSVIVGAMTGPQISGPVETERAGWEEETGGSVEVQTFAYGELFEKFRSGFETGVDAFDIIIANPAWMGDLVEYLAPVPEEYVEAMQLDDVLPIYRDRLLRWGDTLYGFPYDGDAHMLYYRADVLADEEWAAMFEEEYGYPLAPPVTWAQYHDIAAFFNGRDWDRDGLPNFGALEAQVRNAQSFWTYISRATAYAKYPDDPCFFFSCEDMTPNVNNPGWVRALEEYVDITQYGPPGMENYDIGEVRSGMVTGQGVLAVDWADIGTIAIDPDQSIVQGLLGYGILPGAYDVWNPASGEWETFEEVNHGPFLAFGGWTIFVSATATDLDAAFDFAAYMSSPDRILRLNVTPFTGVNPSRYSTFEGIDMWVEAGFDLASAEGYLGAIDDTMNHPNVVLDLRIPGTAEYQSILDTEISRAVAGEVTPQEALDNVVAQWEEVTDRYGREAQLDLYLASLGMEM